MLFTTPTVAAQKPVVLDSTYNHDRFDTEPKDILRQFQAFTTSFDSLDDDNNDGKEDAWRIPEWVAYQIKRYDDECIPTKKRPSWFADPELQKKGVAPSSAIINAFERARTQGRDGKGCVILVAAGNDSAPVNFPGNLVNILTVSASNEYDEPKTKISQDGESWWGSSFGPEVDVAAPGVHNLTTDISGQNGYTEENYVPDFNGTSSSTPIVAGAVGLVLSANKNLTEADVRDIIRNTADKVGPLAYVNGRNDHMGFGRLNVLRAVETVRDGNTTLRGTIKQVGTGEPKAGAFYLETDDGGIYALKAYQGFEAVAWQILEEQSLSYLAQFVNQNVTVNFSRRQDSPYGSILWGVSVT